MSSIEQTKKLDSQIAEFQNRIDEIGNEIYDVDSTKGEELKLIAFGLGVVRAQLNV